MTQLAALQICCMTSACSIVVQYTLLALWDSYAYVSQYTSIPVFDTRVLPSVRVGLMHRSDRDGEFQRQHFLPQQRSQISNDINCSLSKFRFLEELAIQEETLQGSNYI